MGRPRYLRHLRRLRLAFAIAAVVLGPFLIYSLIEPYRVEVKAYTFRSPDLPAAFDGSRLVFVSDIHRGLFVSRERVRGWVAQVNSLKPDVILLGGDYANDNVKNERDCFSELARLRSPGGVFAVLGAHDYGSDPEGGSDEEPAQIREAIGEAGVTLLENQGAWINRGAARIRVGGVKDMEVRTPDAGAALEGTTGRDFVLLLTHSPDYAPELPAGCVDLVLSGHTHGGQITFFGLWAPYTNSKYGQKFRTGMVKMGGGTVIVSNGVGGWFPMRIFARPQIVVVTLRR